MGNEAEVDLVGNEEVEQEQTNADPGTAPVKEPAANAASEQQVEQSPKTVPVERFTQVYGKAERLARENEQLKAQLSNGRYNQPAPVQPQTDVDPKSLDDASWTKKFVVEPVLNPIVQKMERMEKRAALQDAKEALNDFWANSEFASDPQLRQAVNDAYLGAIAKGFAPEQIAHPETLLHTFLGERTAVTSRAQKAAAEGSTAQVQKLNKVARAEAGHQAVPGNNKKKNFDDMSVEEIEAEFGETVIWKPGLRDDD